MESSIKNRQLIEKRIVTYSTLAAAFLAGGRANGSVTVSNPDTALTTYDSFYINFDNTGANEIRIDRQHHSLSYGSVKVQPINGTGYIAKYGLAAAKAFTSGQYIGPTVTWADNLQKRDMAIGSTYGAFASATNKYIGVKFVLSENTHYGWIKVSLTSTSAAEITIHSFGYETTADLGINAGSETSLPVVLTEFSASQDGRAVVLRWVTESEFENLGFVLERQVAGSHEGWVEIASFETDPALEGKGSTAVQSTYKFIDSDVKAGKTYSYRLKDVSYNSVHKSVTHVIDGITVAEMVPVRFGFHPNFPNPFNPETQLSFTLDEANDVKLSVYNLRGQLVKTVLDEHKSAGTHELNFDASELSAGIYMVELVSGAKRQMQKITLIK